LIYVFSVDVWGKGFATEIALALKSHAKEKMNLKRLVSIIETENTLSICVAEKVGMRMEKMIDRPGGKIKRLYSMTL